MGLAGVLRPKGGRRVRERAGRAVADRDLSRFFDLGLPRLRAAIQRGSSIDVIHGGGVTRRFRARRLNSESVVSTSSIFDVYTP